MIMVVPYGTPMAEGYTPMVTSTTSRRAAGPIAQLALSGLPDPVCHCAFGVRLLPEAIAVSALAIERSGREPQLRPG